MLQAQQYSDSASALSSPVLLYNQQHTSMQMPYTSHKDDLQQQPMTINAEPISPAASSLDFMHLADQIDKPTVSELMYPDTDYMDPELFNCISQEDQAINMAGSDNSLYIMGGNLGLSSYINELLSNGYI
jgi:hypothetical protein